MLYADPARFSVEIRAPNSAFFGRISSPPLLD
jgi:hypothetical protein